jgi:glycosyltransferase involved in cell wall biosynthesis
MKLSICIPVYNNKNLFKYSLKSAASAILGFEAETEIVISDNCSEDDIEAIVKEIHSVYPTVKILYSRNEKNRGLAYNFHKAVEMANGEFCWIIGSDDFVYKDSVKTILRVVNGYTHVSFITVSYAHLKLPSVADENRPEDPYGNILDIIEEGSRLTFHEGPISTGEVIWDKLIDPSFNNVMLGAVMAGIFKKSKWESVNRENMDKSTNFNNLENIYPHVYIYANSMIGEPAYYIREPLLVVGDGARPWAGEQFWDGSLPIIYFKVFNEIVEAYKAGGLDKEQLKKCKLSVAHTVGRYLFPYFKQKFIKRKKVKNDEYIKVSKIIKINWKYPIFYLGFVKGVIKETLMKG